MRSLNLTDFLLMLIAASMTKKSPKDIYAAYEAQRPATEPKKPSLHEYTEQDIHDIYRAYPSRDAANKNRRTGKSLADKDLIRRRLKTYTKEQIMEAIDDEVEENKHGKWLKNFSTFLNNLPDIHDDEPTQESIYQ